MAGKIILEYRAKQILYKALGILYNGTSHTTDKDKIPKLSQQLRYVVKIDHGIKKRAKRNLIKLDVPYSEVNNAIKELASYGYTSFLIEPYIDHKSVHEKYISLTRTRSGIQCLFSAQGGVHIEENNDTVSQFQVEGNTRRICAQTGLSTIQFKKILDVFEKHHFSFLEVNPLLVIDGIPYLLDVAAVGDSRASENGKEIWQHSDYVQDTERKTKQEKSVYELSRASNASFALTVINQNGSIGLLLSGGGASLVIADELYQLGVGKKIINYGEYSGNPNQEDIYIYTKNILELLILSKAHKKVLIIGGGVANFTDIRITFLGIIRALEEAKIQLKKQKIKIFVRRGGPHQKEGLCMMRDFITKNKIYGTVSGPELMLSTFVEQIVKMV